MTESVLGDRLTASDVARGRDLTGKNALVTGAASGIGVETARALALAGAAVTLAVRDTGAGADVAADITATTGNHSVSVVPLDLADLASVRALTGSWERPLHILVNNAGIMNAPELRTPQGWEMQFAVNHLGHFALATGLHDALARAGGARIVSVSSSGHANSGIDFDDPFFTRRPYDSGLAYGQSKTANVLFAVEANRRWGAEGIITKAVMPGGVWTNLQRFWNPDILAAMRRQHQGKSPAQGAATSVLVATDPDLRPDGPVYFEDCGPAEVVDDVLDGLHGVVRHAIDPDAATRLWSMSFELITPTGAAPA